MKIEIERVIAADDAASTMVDEARTQADKIVEEARRMAERIIAYKERELASALGAEHLKVVSGAESKARAILVEADGYSERIRERKAKLLDGLVAQLLRKVTGA
jgi:vacuolar-type H+-ATPase subunit H